MHPKRTNKVLFVPQHATPECGYACLAMILGALGRKTSVSEIREQFPIGRDGVGSNRIVAIAKSFGVIGRVYCTEDIKFDRDSLPLIIHWGLSHWVVLESFSKNCFVIADPAIGRRKIDRQEFSNYFTGVFIEFKIGHGFTVKKRATPSPAWKMLRTALDDVSGKRLLVFMLIASALLQILGLALPLLIKVIVDGILPGKFRTALPLISLAIVLLVLTRIVTELFRSLSLIRLRTSLDARSMAEVVSSLFRLPYSFFRIHSHGDLVYRVTGFMSVRQLITMYGINSALDGLFVIGYLGAISLASVWLSVIVAGFVVFQTASLAIAKTRLRQLSKVNYLTNTQQTTYLMDMLNGVEYLKASGSEESALKHWLNLLHNQLAASQSTSYMSTILSSISILCNVGVPLLVLVIGTELTLDGRMTPGAMLGTTALVGMLFGPLSNLVNFYQQLQDVTGYVDRVDDMISTPKEVLQSSAEVDVKGCICFRDVSFVYPGSSSFTISGISFQIDSGETAALVGPTGSGKSTLARLIIGLDTPSGGEVLFDGVPLSRLNLVGLRQNVGFVPQHPTLFHGTIRENISFGMPQSNLRDVIEASKLACIHEDISKLPLGYDTVVSEQGLNFSGGQRQRLAIARALLRRPRILVMDEATSHLDSEVERRVSAAIEQLCCTRILIAHRLSTIRDADHILVLDQGRLIEVGRHEELMRRESRYASLVRLQFEGKNLSVPKSLGSVKVTVACHAQRTGGNK